jgi:predicted helicase
LRDKLPADAADEAAQSLVYGLFAAAWFHEGDKPFRPGTTVRRLLREQGGAERRAQSTGSAQVPATPLREHARAITELLARVDRSAVRADLRRARDGRDPALHLYEDFLRVYDPKARGARGVYYTPAPVVSFVVRSADELLRGRLGLADGLASPEVCVLDPACGTGAFLCAVVEHVRAAFEQKRLAGEWSTFARGRLAAWLIGLERLPAPCAVARMALEARLVGGGARRRGDGLVRVYCADALGDPSTLLRVLPRAAPVRVVLGNPPYSGISDNRAEWIDGLLHGRLPGGGPGASYYHVDGRPLRERKVWLQDDYVKFMRMGQWIIERSEAGVLAFVTNHSWVDNPTFRGMRQSLMQTFDDIRVLDLHGNAKRKEACPDGAPDENVFNIQQGVAVALFVKGRGRRGGAVVRHGELWGSRRTKFARLERADAGRMRLRRLDPVTPQYFFVPRDGKLRAEYERGWKITDIMPVFTTGIVTARDRFVIDFDEESLLERMAKFRGRRFSDAEIRRKYFAGRGSPRYPPGDSRGWKLSGARRRVRADRQWRERVVPCLYRPFDVRPLYYVPWMVDWPRAEVMRHLLAGENLALITVRQVAEGRFNHAFVTDTIADGRVTLSNKGISYVFPLYLYGQGDGADGAGRRANIAPEFISLMTRRLGRRKAVGAPDALYYIYATLHSPDYATRYAEFLQGDFPRIPILGDRERFRMMVRTGRTLVSLHLLRHPKLDKPAVTFPIEGSNLVAPGHPKYVAPGEPDPYDPRHRPVARGRAYINRPDPSLGTPAQYFDGVTPETWNHQLCGYQPARHFLCARRGRALEASSVRRYGQLSCAIRHVIALGEV